VAIHKLGDEISDKKLKALLNDATNSKGLLGKKHSDGGGLYLQVAAPGQGSWIVRFGEKWKSLGPADEISPQEARDWHALMKQAKRAGRDPFAVTYADFKFPTAAGPAARQALPEAQEAIGETFGQVLAEYIKEKSRTWTPAVATNWRNNFDKVPALLAEPADNVSAKVIAEACATFTDVVGDRMRRNIRAVVTYGETRHIKKKLETTHHGAMIAKNVPGFMAELAAIDTRIARALDFTIHTAARSGEVFKATWKEVVEIEGLPVWIIPAAHRQKGKAKLKPRDLPVPITPQAFAALGPRGADDAPIFGKLRRDVMQKLLRSLRPDEVDADGNLLDVHGFRSTFRDWVTETTDFGRDLAELACGHKVGDVTEQSYARGSQFDKRRDLMTAWSDYITTKEKTQ
jgi:integrase